MDIPLVLYRWDKSQSDTEFTITSSKQKRNITNGEYLSPSKGVSGQIVGFLEYNKYKEDIEEAKGEVVFPNFPTLSRSEIAFGGTKTHPDLIVIVPKHLQELVTSKKNVPKHLQELVTSKKIVHVELDTDRDKALSTCINTKAEIIQHAKLGELMGEHANNAEHNFVGDHTFEVRVLKNATKLKYKDKKKFMDDIYAEASKLGTTVKIEETIQADDRCDETGPAPKVGPYDYYSEPEPEPDTDDAPMFIPMKKTTHGRGRRKKTLRRKKRRHVRTRKVI